MKSTGIVRKVDELGRVVLPIELRRNMGIEIKDSLEIFVDENTIILQKYEPADIFTGSMDDLIDYKGKKVSKASILEMARIFGVTTDYLLKGKESDFMDIYSQYDSKYGNDMSAEVTEILEDIHQMGTAKRYLIGAGILFVVIAIIAAFVFLIKI